MRFAFAIIDLLAAAVTVATLVVGLVVAATVAAGADLVAAKQLLFGIGLLVATVSVLQLRSRLTLDDTADRTGTRSAEPSRLRPVLDASLPDSWVVSPQDRFSHAAKRAVAGVVILLVTYVMEAGFGIGA